MRIEQLQYLVETAKAASINKASERLHLSQQSLNTALSKLEEEVGAALLVRNSRGVRLTDVGQRVVDYAEEILALVEKMQREVQGLAPGVEDGGFRGHLKLSAGPAFVQGLLPQVLAQVAKVHKQVRISLAEQENLEMIKGLLNNEPRLYLMTVLEGKDREFAMLDLRRLYYQKLGQSRVFALVSQKHPLAKQKSVTLRTLHKYPLAIFQASEKSPNPMQTVMEELGKPKIAVQTNCIELCRQYIDSAEAVGFMPQFTGKAVNDVREGAVLVAIRDLPPTDMLCIADRSYYQGQREIIDYLVELLQVYIKGSAH